MASEDFLGKTIPQGVQLIRGDKSTDVHVPGSWSEAGHYIGGFVASAGLLGVYIYTAFREKTPEEEMRRCCGKFVKNCTKCIENNTDESTVLIILICLACAAIGFLLMAIHKAYTETTLRVDNATGNFSFITKMPWGGEVSKNFQRSRAAARVMHTFVRTKNGSREVFQFYVYPDQTIAKKNEENGEWEVTPDTFVAANFPMETCYWMKTLIDTIQASNYAQSAAFEAEFEPDPATQLDPREYDGLDDFDRNDGLGGFEQKNENELPDEEIKQLQSSRRFTP